MSSVLEPQRRIPVRENFDVIVVGGGIAGVAAALAAAREGASTCLLEKEYGLGGLATLGNIIIYLPLCDGFGHLISAGIAEMLLKLSVRDGSHLVTPGGSAIPECWQKKSAPELRSKQRYLSAYNPATFAFEMEKLLLKNGVTLRYDARFCSVHKKGNVIDAVIIEDKGGRAALGCRAVVDASGDADVCLAAGEPLAHCDVNVPCGWFYYLDNRSTVKLAKHTEPYDAGAMTLPKNATAGLTLRDSRDVTAHILASNKSMARQLDKLRKNHPESPLHILRPPSISSFRMTRRLAGIYELCEKDDRRFFDDTVGMISDWRKSGPVFGIPFRSLYAPGTANLITAGRCISSAHNTWDIVRVIPACAVTGEAAGAASAMLARHQAKSFCKLDVPALQTLLKKRRVLINPKLMACKTTQIRADAPTSH